MISKWYEQKENAIYLRKSGISLGGIEKSLGIPKSTLSLWFKDVILTPQQLKTLEKRKKQGLIKAREMSIISHNNQKKMRLELAENEAKKTFDKLSLTDSTVELALAMLYMGEGSKNNVTSLGSSNPLILKFFLTVLIRKYNVDLTKVRFDLHLRYDQDPTKISRYWANELNIPITSFKYIGHDIRTRGKTTYPNYKGVCLINCGNIAVQRKLKYLYTIFCEKVINDWAISSVG